MSIYSDMFQFATTSTGSQWKFMSRDNMQFYLKYWRAGLDQRPPPALFANCRVEQKLVAERPVFNLRFRQGSSKKHVIFLHGGSFVNPMALLHWQFVQRLMKDTACQVSVPLYGLAPKYNHRHAYDLLQQHYLELLEEHAPEDIILMGDSAGGGLALSFAQWAQTQSLPSVGGVVMISPWLDLTLSNPAIEKVQSDDGILAVPGNREAGEIWAAGEDPRDPKLSPIYGRMNDLPRLCLLIGTNDILLPDARRLQERCLATGTPLAYHEFPEMYHLWALLPTLEGFAAMELMEQFMAADEVAVSAAH